MLPLEHPDRIHVAFDALTLDGRGGGSPVPPSHDGQAPVPQGKDGDDLQG